MATLLHLTGMRQNFLLLLAACWLMSSCENPDAHEPVPNPPQDIDSTFAVPLETSFLQIDTSSGIHIGKLELTNGRFMNYAVKFPENSMGGHLPLIITLHGGAGGPYDYMRCLPIPAFLEERVILFGPSGNQWWKENEEAIMIELMTMAFQHWPIDTARVAVTGYSNGGTGSVFYAIHHPEIFTAAIPMAANYEEELCPVIPTYFIHGTEDEFYSYHDLRKRISGCGSYLKPLTGLSHGDACRTETVLALRDSWVWLSNIWNLKD